MTQHRAKMSFETGIGQDAGAAPDAAIDTGNALARLQAHRAVPPAPPAAKDVARERNPDLPRCDFEDLKHLPSQGKSYPEGTTIRYRPYTMGESVYVENSKLTLDQTYEFILRGVEASFDTKQLTLPDALFLGLMRRLATLGDTKVSVNSTCPHCGGLNQTAVDTTALEFDDLSVPALPIQAQFSFTPEPLRFSPLTVEDYLRLGRLKKLDDVIALYAVQCRSLEFADAYERFTAITAARDIRLLHKIDELLHHELKPLIIKCPQPLTTESGEAGTCGGTYPVNLDNVSSAFVLPFRGWGDDDLQDQITFGA